MVPGTTAQEPSLTCQGPTDIPSHGPGGAETCGRDSLQTPSHPPGSGPPTAMDKACLCPKLLTRRKEECLLPAWGCCRGTSPRAAGPPLFLRIRLARGMKDWHAHTCCHHPKAGHVQSESPRIPVYLPRNMCMVVVGEPLPSLSPVNGRKSAFSLNSAQNPYPFA